MNNKSNDHYTLVKVYFQDKPIGLYRARDFTQNGLLLEHGAIMFPTGSNLKLKIMNKGKLPYTGLAAEVVCTDDAGMQLRFSSLVKPEDNNEQWVVDWQLPCCYSEA